MYKKLILTCSLIGLISGAANAALVNSEKTINVNGDTRKYVLYVPNNVSENPPLVFSLHGASGHDTDRSPFRTSVADSEGCIVVYPQGNDQYFPVFGGSIPGWNSTGEANEDLDFFKAIIEEVAQSYDIDRTRIYCCGFSNGGMMTYSNVSSASDIFAAYASISGFQLNEFHQRNTGYRPVPFLHIHGKSDDFVKYSCMPIICDNMVARNGCNPVPEVTTVSGKYTKNVYAAGEGGFPYVYYEMDGMWHSDYTDNTEDGNSALTMWKFMSQYTLNDPCDRTLKWRLNIDTEGYEPKSHKWKVNTARTKFIFGRAKLANNADNNVYPSLQLEAGDYTLTFESTGSEDNLIYVKVEALTGGDVLFCKAGKVGTKVVMPFTVPEYTEYKMTIIKTAADDLFTSYAIHSCETPVQAENSYDSYLPGEEPEPEQGYLIEIPQDQGKQYDDFSRTDFEPGESYNTYTANADLQIAFKMMDIDVADCDYVVVKFAEPVAAGWHLAFWSGTDLTEVPEGTQEYTFELEPSMLSTGILPQICMMTFFGGYQAPLVAKVTGVYKHCTLPAAVDNIANGSAVPVEYINLWGISSQRAMPGINIVKMSDGSTRKVLYR